ncbi:hypothetical protein SpCBS45565_g02472 [Spizellomyces sp. 'palustris']|nr:hypothetical protein SpCBS45565_g02472 [Spizellomyces sp. 'palustris']
MWYDQTIDGDYTALAVHPTFPALAAANKDGRVDLFDEEGQKRPQADICRVPGSVILRWHPSQKLLAISWSNGTAGIWSDAEAVLREGNVHGSSITVVEWSPLGNRLDGDVVVWKVDPRGRLSILCQYRLHNSITHCIFRSHRQELDLRSGTSPPFFLSTTNGSIHYADDMGHCTESASTASQIATLLMLEHKDMVVIITNDLLLHQYSLASDGKMTQESQMKLSTSAKADNRAVIATWAGPAILALSVGGQPIWIWDIENEENSVLRMEKVRINCIAFSNTRNMLAAGTDSGHVMMWKARYVPEAEGMGVQTWETISKTNLGGAVDGIAWGAQSGLLGARKRSGLKILTEQVLRKKVWGRNAIVQVEQNKVIIYPGGKEPIARKVDLRIKGLTLSRNLFAVWNGTTIEVQEYSEAGQPMRNLGALANSDPSLDLPLTASGNRLDYFLAAWNDAQDVEGGPTSVASATFAAESNLINLDDQFIYIGKSNRVEVCNHQGVTKSVLSLPESEGEIVLMETVPSLLLIITSRNYLKLFSTSHREPKQVVSKRIDDNLGIHSIASAKCNANGTMISFLACVPVKGATQLQQFDTKVYVYDVEKDVTLAFDMKEHGQMPVSHFWDWEDPRILVCQSEGYATPSQDTGPDTLTKATPTSQIVSFFVTSDYGTTLHDITTSIPNSDALFGIYMPFHYYIKESTQEEPDYMNMVSSIVARDFEGLENTDTTTMKAMIDFSFHIAVGNMDESLKALKLIKSTNVWETMAKMCVKTKRIDVATLCLSNMGNAKAVHALHQVDPTSPPELKAAIVALHLGMNDDVESLYLSCGRYDLLNRFYQATCQWEKALQIAATHDRIHLRSTFYNFACYLEELGDTSGAVAAFEKSSTHSFEIPRMLLGKNEVPELEKYITTSENQLLKKWWGQFTESHGDLDSALRYYELAGDTLSIVRIHCLSGDIERAIDIAEKANSPAAAYHIAHYFETESKLADAISFYAKAKCYNHAIRLAKEHRLDNELMHLALQGSQQALMDVARYFEKSGKHLEKAISLYHRGGNLGRAIDLCFQTNQPAMLEDIEQDFNSSTDPVVLQKCASFFIQNSQFERAVRLLMLAQKFDEALDLCATHGIVVTEAMADAIPIPAVTENDDQDRSAKEALLRIADCCMEQGSYHLACKKYTLAGDRMKAMKALLKSGDTEKILFFANVSGPKQRDIFVLAANYLQTLDWRNDTQIMKAIITFYTKGKALESLAAFYEACAQVEIDEYQNYEKALAALKEAWKCMTKLKDQTSSTTMLRSRSLTQKIDCVSQFVEARQYAKTDTVTMFKICEELLHVPDIDHNQDGVRLGDIFALMIESHYDNGYYDQARNLLDRMRRSVANINVEYYIDRRMVQSLEHPGEEQRGSGGGDEVIDEEIMNGE